MHFRDFCTPAATACPPQIPLNGWARDTTKEEVWRLNLWLKRNTQSMFSDPKQTQWMGKNARQEAGMSPRLTSSCYRLGSPSTRLTRKQFLWSQMSHKANGFSDKATAEEKNLGVCDLASPIQPYLESKRRRYRNEICDTQSGF